MSAHSPTACSGAAAPIQGAAELVAQARRSQALLKDLSAARDDVLAPVDLNRILRLLLANQSAMMSVLAQVSGGGSGLTAPSQQLPSALTTDSPAAPAPAPAPEPTAGEPTAGEPAAGETSGPETSASLAEQFLGVLDLVRGAAARGFVEAFDHRDKDFAKGLEKLNRWTEGTGGTPFQVREDRAYLNLGSSAEGAQRYEKNLMERMGFSRRIGRLTISGLEGEVVVYERPQAP